MVSRHQAKSSGHSPCGSEDIMALVAEEEIPDVVASIRYYCLFLMDMS